ncbi:hypothetical protein [Dactylococcopsis salina]|uniref:Uncharacterized protein n=1 Tax=Dactylococcopsis salina (strain PCC 8305) TaxID=13035 RepID=K9YXP8_DACS8|nr:hypothetical protein [Dactylococcopsis salina]AFZ51272.1 hypothetical protein Dacsa_2695 [Dactylococcopsis salina PCC 8305]
MDMRSLRKLHRRIAPILFLPLFLTAFTGVAYRVANSWFNTPDRVGAILMYFHQGTFLGEELRVFYFIPHLMRSLIFKENAAQNW